MENGLNTGDKLDKMGATSNSNAAKLAVLQERKKQLEDSLCKSTQDLRQLCIQEAELTGVIPQEMPLEAGETLPLIRRRVGTSYQLNENLVPNDNKDIADLELQIQLHAKLAEAALGLANEHNLSKTVKRQHVAEYRKHKSHCVALQDKLALLKEQQFRLKKKSRYPDVQVDDNISISTIATTDGPMKHDSHSLRSLKANSVISTSNDSCIEQRYNPSVMKDLYRNSDVPYLENYFLSRNEDALASGFYRLSLNGYNKYMERFEGLNNQPYNRASQYSTLQLQNLQYNLSHIHNQNVSYNTHASQHFYHHPSQHSPRLSESSPHTSQHSPLLPHHSPHMSHKHSPQQQRNSPQLSHSPNVVSQHNVLQRLSQNNYNVGSVSGLQNFNRQSSPTASASFNTKYYPIHGSQGESMFRQPSSESVMSYKNPHQLQPHQQYEHNGMTSGLGGCWKRSETGEMFWCNSNTLDSSWQKDKRFGSLDRRKNKKVHKRISPADNKCATIGSSAPSNYQNQVRALVCKPSQVGNRRSQDHRQLVRTQSLGSVGAQTIDSVYPSDDNSSCESDCKSINGNRYSRRHKEKEWLETSLDGPISPSHSIGSHSHSIASTTVLAPEEQYTSPGATSPTLLHRPRSVTPKATLEIPAESNPSPRIPDTNFDLYSLNNNIPKNCTVVQAGQCKPYHEETKPFEMSDFYKYSTKFKKSPVKTQEFINVKAGPQNNVNVEKSLNSAFEESFQNKTATSSQHSFSSMNNNMVDAVEKPSNLNVSIDLSHIGVSENFSAEMNAWYSEHEDASTSKSSRSTATLV